MERHKRPGKKQTVSKSDSKDWEPLKVGITQSSSKEFNLDDVLDDEIDHDVIAKKLVDWTPSDVKRWMYNEGFSSFWPFIQQHNPTGIDLMMLNEVKSVTCIWIDFDSLNKLYETIWELRLRLGIF